MSNCTSEPRDFALLMELTFSCPQALVSNVVEKGGVSSGDVAAQYKHKNAVIDVKLDTESNVVPDLIFFKQI